ncbi:M16 family metallopeptidase [Gilvimarinus sp. F26214L]|uniref:M16 family metallopeptidase n=1 Tax=Gilvimarinus sp. DZF01 TaxID=3461371 RepID=UPI0040457BB0
MKLFSRLLILLLLLFPIISAAELEFRPDPEPRPNNFAQVETWDYPSGLRVHFKSMPQVSDIYIQVLLPVGSSLDPKGREGLAHFVEHMVFTDHRGRTEEEIKQSVLDRGGRKNATTSRYETRYYVDLPAAEWRFGLNWMHDLLRGHRFGPAVADAERRVVMLEKSRRYPASTEPLDRIQQWLWGNKLLVKSDVWERELGLVRDYRSVIGSYPSLRGIDVADLQGFYDRYYGPQNMTVMIVGDAPRDAVKQLVDQSFGTWAPQGERVSTLQEVRPSRQPTRRVSFRWVQNVDHKLRYKLFSPSAYDLEMAWFSARFLRHLLNQRLRVESKATYAVSVNVDAYAGHGLVSISGNYARGRADHVEREIRDTLAELQQGRLPGSVFENVRARAVSDLTMGYPSAASIARLCSVDVLCNKDIYSGFPDRVAHWQGLSQRELSEWMTKTFTPANELLELTRPIPIALVWLEGVGPLVVLFLIIRMLRSRWARPVDMREIRYLCKLRLAPGLLALWMLTASALGFLLVAVGYNGWETLALTLAKADSYALQRTLPLALLAAGMALVFSVPALVPRKLLFFTHHWRIKFWTFRSTAYDYRDVRELRECSFFSVLFSRRAFTTVFLHWGMGQGVYLRVGDRLGYFFRVRDNRELLGYLQQRGVPMAELVAQPDQEAGIVAPEAG